MAITAAEAAPGTGAGGDGSAVHRWASTRHVYIDNLKIVLIATIIALHAILGYAGTIEAWS